MINFNEVRPLDLLDFFLIPASSILRCLAVHADLHLLVFELFNFLLELVVLRRSYKLLIGLRLYLILIDGTVDFAEKLHTLSASLLIHQLHSCVIIVLVPHAFGETLGW